MVVDFILFSIVRREVHDHTSATASWGNAIWMTVAATVVLFFASFIVCFECFGSRRRTRTDRNAAYAPNGYVGNQPGMEGNAAYRKHWWSRNRGVGKYAY